MIANRTSDEVDCVNRESCVESLDGSANVVANSFVTLLATP